MLAMLSFDAKTADHNARLASAIIKLLRPETKRRWQAELMPCWSKSQFGRSADRWAPEPAIRLAGATSALTASSLLPRAAWRTRSLPSHRPIAGHRRHRPICADDR